MPMNSITEKFWYTSEDSKNMRVVVSALTEHPTVWTVTKVENSMPFGIQKLTIYTAFWNEHTDYVNLETGEMYANYFDSEIAPTDPSMPTPVPSSITARISASTSTIKVGGSYKNLTVNLFNDLIPCNNLSRHYGQLSLNNFQNDIELFSGSQTVSSISPPFLYDLKSVYPSFRTI